MLVAGSKVTISALCCISKWHLGQKQFIEHISHASHCANWIISVLFSWFCEGGNSIILFSLMGPWKGLRKRNWCQSHTQGLARVAWKLSSDFKDCILNYCLNWGCLRRSHSWRSYIYTCINIFYTIYKIFFMFHCNLAACLLRDQKKTFLILNWVLILVHFC